jgi:hypothetical protein
VSTDLVTTGTPLDDLNPRQQLAVQLYTNPMLGRTFGNKSASATAAGFSSSTALDSIPCQAAIAWIMEQKAANADRVATYLSAFTMDAARKLVTQMGADDGIEPKPMPEGLLDREPEPIIGQDKDGGDRLLGYSDGHLKLAKEITAHNRAAAGLMKEVREALKLVLAYHLGTPEQKISVERGSKQQDPLDLGALDDEQLRQLARHVQEVRSMKQGMTITQEETDEGEDTDPLVD